VVPPRLERAHLVVVVVRHRVPDLVGFQKFEVTLR
jgi:hypothetical protein